PKAARKAPAARKAVQVVITPYRAPQIESIAVEIARILKSKPTAITEGDEERAGKLAFIAFASIMDLT
ncbi:hypothetical protein, partial [Klebsiella pneumoniae]|uniref:hypothetical protein n=1 Tax=Klebsiella pneumoniae TaxID=573 RepID=UPI0013D85D4D